MAKAIGLGEITPVKLKLTRENFNALIKRHSQPIRWLTAEKCACILNNEKVDENCPLCKGKSVTYETIHTSQRVELLKASLDGVIDKENVIYVRDLKGVNYPIAAQDCVAYVPGVIKGRTYEVKFTEDVSLSDSAEAAYVSESLYSVNISTPVAFGEVQGSLLSVEAVSEGSPLTVTNIFRNCFEIEEAIPEAQVVTATYTYVNPFEFALIQNKLERDMKKYLDNVGGDGILIFPQRWNVYKSDIIIAQNATLMKKEVFRSTGDIDSLPSFYLYEMLQASAIRDDKKHEFTPNIDFIIYKNNQIKWISENKPTENEQLSISYIYNLVFRVLVDIPDPRSSENNRFPRKVVLKLYTDFNSREGF